MGLNFLLYPRSKRRKPQENGSKKISDKTVQ